MGKVERLGGDFTSGTDSCAAHFCLNEHKNLPLDPIQLV